MSEREIFDEALQRLIGEQLSSVVFVQDYVQLRFDGPCLNVYSASHQVLKNQASWLWGQPGYRDALCSLITHQVKKAQIVPSESLSFTFDDDSVWSMSLRDEDYRGPEAFGFRDEIRNLWVVE